MYQGDYESREDRPGDLLAVLEVQLSQVREKLLETATRRNDSRLDRHDRVALLDRNDIDLTQTCS